MLKNWSPRHTLISILLLGLLQSLIYAVIVPPWWHYDEPGHFEYVWLAANLPAWPKVGQYDQTMRQEMAESMLKYKWYKARLNNPDLSGTTPIPIGVPEVGGEPAYYFLASLPLRFHASYGYHSPILRGPLGLHHFISVDPLGRLVRARRGFC